MANLALDKQTTMRGPAAAMQRLPIQASTLAYQGASLTRDSSGYVGERLATERFAGFAHTRVDNSAGSAAASGKDVDVKTRGEYLLAVSGATAADIGRSVFTITDDQTFSFVPVAGQYVGYVTQYDSSGYVWVLCDRPGAFAYDTFVILADDATFALPACQAMVQVIGGGEMGIFHIGAAGATTLPSATATATVEQAGSVTLVDALAATTTAKATQYDLTGGNGSLANIVDPDVPRNVIINFTDGDAGISAFTLTVTGTDASGDALVEVFVFAGGLDQTGVKAFATITTIVLTDLVGAGAADTIDIGHGVIYGVPLNGGSNFAVTHLAVAGVEEAAAAQSAANGTFTPTTAADGAKEIMVTYTYDTAESMTVTGVLSATANVAGTDSDTDLCVYDAGANAVLKNRLGVSATFAVRITEVP